MTRMNNYYKMYSCPFHAYQTMYSCPHAANVPMDSLNYAHRFGGQYSPSTNKEKNTGCIDLRDYGPEPFVINIDEAAKQNNNYRLALWTGDHLQVTLMSIKVGGDIGLEIHPDVDQFIRIEQGQGLVKMGDRQDRLNFQRAVYDDYAFVIPAGTWHNLINTGNVPIKLYSIYAPPQHPRGTIHKTKADAEADE